jgi:hypothetical protein
MIPTGTTSASVRDCCLAVLARAHRPSGVPRRGGTTRGSALQSALHVDDVCGGTGGSARRHRRPVPWHSRACCAFDEMRNVLRRSATAAAAENSRPAVQVSDAFFMCLSLALASRGTQHPSLARSTCAAGSEQASSVRSTAVASAAE